MFVKICGLRTAVAVQAAVDGGADALGFVFAESVRRVSPDAAAALCRDVPAEIRRVAVMRHPSAIEWAEVRDIFDPDWLQTDAGDFAGLDLGQRCVALPVFRDAEVSVAEDWPSPMLFEGSTSGSGQIADWHKAAAIAGQAELILAGGLSVENIATAIATVTPWGVDVSSGVESSPGSKDPDMIIEFIARARAAEND